MLQKLKNNLIILASVLTLSIPALMSASTAQVFAAYGSCNSDISGNLSYGAVIASGDNSVGCTNSNVDKGSIANLASGAVKIFSVVVGGVAVIMIIYGGFRYITSGGSQERVSSAKNTLIYAIVGLLIVALAQIIVHFVLSQSNNIQSGAQSANN